MSDAGGTRYDLSVKHTINALVSEAKALETQIENMDASWTTELALTILNDDDVDFEHEIEQSAIKYSTLQNMRNKLEAKKYEIDKLLKPTSSTDEQICHVITDSVKKKDELISLGNQLILKNMLKMMLMHARNEMKAKKGKAKRGKAKRGKWRKTKGEEMLMYARKRLDAIDEDVAADVAVDEAAQHMKMLRM